MYTVKINGIHYETEVPLQEAIDYVLYKMGQAMHYDAEVIAMVIDAETGEIVYSTSTFLK